MLWLSLGHSPTSGETVGRVEKTAGDQLGIWISHLYMSQTMSVGTRDLNATFLGTRAHQGTARSHQCSPQELLPFLCAPGHLQTFRRTWAQHDTANPCSPLGWSQSQGDSQGLIGISGWPQEHWQPHSKDGCCTVATGACTFLDLTQTNNADTLMRFFQIKNYFINFGCICTDFLVKGSSSPY